MADSKTVAPYACLPLLEEVAMAADLAPDSFGLPASFPADLLTADQRDEVAIWFDAWVADLLQSIRAALAADAAHTTLQTLQVRAVILAHLLRLHPAADTSLTTLANQLGISRRSAFYAQEDIVKHIRPALCGTIRANTAAAMLTTQLADTGTLLPDAAVTLPARQLAVPFKPHVHMAHRFATVQRVATLPAVASVHDDFMPGTTQHAIIITLKA